MSALDEESYTGRIPCHLTTQTKKNILFCCECNLNRSPVFEKWFKENRPQYNIKSCGTSYGYPNRLSEELIKWADIIYVMDIEQEIAISWRFPEYLHKVEVIGVSDGTPNLIRIIEYWTKKKGL